MSMNVVRQFYSSKNNLNYKLVKTGNKLELFKEVGKELKSVGKKMYTTSDNIDWGVRGQVSKIWGNTFKPTKVIERKSDYANSITFIRKDKDGKELIYNTFWPRDRRYFVQYTNDTLWPNDKKHINPTNIGFKIPFVSNSTGTARHNIGDEWELLNKFKNLPNSALKILKAALKINERHVPPSYFMRLSKFE